MLSMIVNMETLLPQITKLIIKNSRANNNI